MKTTITGLVRPSNHGLFDVYNGILSFDGIIQNKLRQYKGKRVIITIEEETK